MSTEEEVKKLKEKVDELEKRINEIEENAGSGIWNKTLKEVLDEKRKE